ncbi:hypothetical protein ACFQ8C_34920 [Streptomyces sp. NPDC056503]|uniref:hypothetical protein n=1 Tax=Streptomyces sp. NPDC056503 TaxID=3345842 RepID=UPI0036A0DBD0
MHARRKAAFALASAAAMAGTLLATAPPAQAYGTLDVRYARVDTDNCDRISGTLPVTPAPGGCYLYDSLDDTYFEKDADGEALKVEVRNAGRLVSKVEFHPKGENLWIYDPAADGDTVYVRLWTKTHGWSAVFYATGDQNPHVVPFDFAEGENVLIEIYDHSDATDRIASFSARA